MKKSGNELKRHLQNLTIVDYNFKNGREFTYLYAFMNYEKLEEEIKE
jgi:hypothetical protein